jgi:hypothetical protein
MILRPNPAFNTLQVMINALPITLPVTLVMLTVAGTVIKSMPLYLVNNQVTLDISMLPPGAYTLRFICNGKVLTRRFVKT